MSTNSQTRAQNVRFYVLIVNVAATPMVSVATAEAEDEFAPR